MFSDTLRVRNGVRQGGVLSPSLFNINVIESNSGCYLYRTCVACIMYADDLMLSSSSVSGIQKLLDVCALTGKEVMFAI